MNIADIIRAAGGASKVARAIGRHHATILRWRQVPAQHARQIEALSGISRHQLRPDLFDAPTPAPAAAQPREAPRLVAQEAA
jgi:DNA-binding transcriptional regulator YdaS (Cro superfamily)